MLQFEQDLLKYIPATLLLFNVSTLHYTISINDQA